METLNNPHDKFFKEVMGQREIARDFERLHQLSLQIVFLAVIIRYGRDE